MSPAKKDNAVSVVKFYDAAFPDNIPAKARSAVYCDGDFTATPAQIARLGPVRLITVLGNFKLAGIADYEPGNLVFGVPGKLRTWALGRRSMNCRARVYSDLSNLASAVDQCAGLENVVYWIATDDGQQFTLDEIVSLCEPHAHLEPSQVWANQYSGAPQDKYDESVLFGVW